METKPRPATAEPAPVVFVLDDDLSVREGLGNLLRSVGLNVETFGSATEFLSAHRPDVPGCLVLDVRLPGVSGLDLQRQLADSRIHLPVIFITAHGDVPMSVRAMKAGAVEFLAKPFRDQELLDAVHEAVERDRENRRRRTETELLRECYESLTAREREVMLLVVQGHANKQVGDLLNISEPTVKMHRGRLMHKMHVDSLAELIRAAEKLPPPALRAPPNHTKV